MGIALGVRGQIKELYLKRGSLNFIDHLLAEHMIPGMQVNKVKRDTLIERGVCENYIIISASPYLSPFYACTQVS